MSLPRYPAYKDSWVEWLPQIPNLWTRSALRNEVARWHSGGTPDTDNPSLWGDEEDGIPWVSIADITRSTEITRTDRRISKLGVQSKNLEVLPSGTLLFSMYASVGKVAQLRVPAAINQAILGLGFGAHTDAGFVRYWLTFLERYLPMFTSSNTQDNLNAAKVRSLPVFIPSLEEQRSIATFLDRETAKIDALVAEQQRLMELLKEKRQAVISHAVTKGLNQDAPKKDSGVEWLGEVPAHWAVRPLGRSIDFLTDYEANGSFADTKANVVLDTGTPFAWYVRATDLERNRHGLVDENRFCDATTFGWLKKTELHGGELLIAKRGEIGKAYVMPDVDCAATLAPNLYLVRLTEELRAAFAWYWFTVDPGKAELALANKSTTIGALYKDDLRACLTFVPPVHEQDQIIEELRRSLSAIDELRSAALNAEILLKERRTALISAAVTGQIDVRDIAKQSAAA